jgi:hypothetical protein
MRQSTVPNRPAYQHRQWGWLAIVAAVASAVLASLLVSNGRWSVAVVGLAVATILLLVFGWLTVRVDDDAIEARFGIGLIRRTVPFSDVQGYRAVRNPWYYGWGIRLIPAGWLLNVSGLSALELDLPAGRRVRIGTDEPERLVDVLSRVIERSPTAPSG